jgi:hypothetical protein
LPVTLGVAFDVTLGVAFGVAGRAAFLVDPAAEARAVGVRAGFVVVARLVV